MEPIQDFYRGKTIFITGASGFIGKVLVEKLLYSCTGLKRVYITMRPKRGKTVNQRMEDMWKLPLFERLCKQRPEAMKKIVPLEGDILEDNLGLKPSDLEILQKEVEIVFHNAATLKLEADLRDAIIMNTTGTERVLNICKTIKNLKVFVHVSTAFCYPDMVELDEKVYDGPDDPREIMRICSWMTNDAINHLTPKLLQNHANSYTYSKRLAECLVRDEYPNIPGVIARPSIVIPTWSEPISGWVDTLNGPVGVMIGAGKGVIRTMYCDGTSPAEIIPVDYVVNALINIPYTYTTEQKNAKEIPVYNLTVNDAKNITWEYVLNLSKEMVKIYPLDFPLWYPDGNIRTNRFVHVLFMILFHWIPAILIDTLMFILRQKRFMIRIQKRITLGLKLLEYFTGRHWKFHNDNYKLLQKKLTSVEKDVFPLDFTLIEEREYFKRCIIGSREYCLKEPMANIGRARVTHTVMYILDRIVKFLFYGWILMKIYGIAAPWFNNTGTNPGLGSSVMAD